MMTRTDACSRLLIGVCLMVLSVPQHVFVLSQGSDPVVSITFDNNRPGVSFISNNDNVNITTSTEVAGSVDGFVGFFDGENNLEFNLWELDSWVFNLSRFSTEIRFLDTEVSNDRYSVLLGSRRSISIGLIRIGLSMDYKLRVYLNTFTERVFLEMLYQYRDLEAISFSCQNNTMLTMLLRDNGETIAYSSSEQAYSSKPGWKDLRLDYNLARQNSSFHLKLEDSTGRIKTLTKHVTGNIYVPNIVVGAEERSHNNFVGFMDNVKIWIGS